MILKLSETPRTRDNRGQLSTLSSLTSDYIFANPGKHVYMCRNVSKALVQASYHDEILWVFVRRELVVTAGP